MSLFQWSYQPRTVLVVVQQYEATPHIIIQRAILLLFDKDIVVLLTTALILARIMDLLPTNRKSNEWSFPEKKTRRILQASTSRSVVKLNSTFTPFDTIVMFTHTGLVWRMPLDIQVQCRPSTGLSERFAFNWLLRQLISWWPSDQPSHSVNIEFCIYICLSLTRLTCPWN